MGDCGCLVTGGVAFGLEGTHAACARLFVRRGIRIEQRCIGTQTDKIGRAAQLARLFINSRHSSRRRRTMAMLLFRHLECSLVILAWEGTQVTSVTLLPGDPWIDSDAPTSVICTRQMNAIGWTEEYNAVIKSLTSSRGRSTAALGWSR